MKDFDYNKLDEKRTYTPDPQSPSIHDYSTGEMPAETEQQWTSEQLQADFDVLAFQAPYVKVRRKSDGLVGIMQFNHNPRIYFNFQRA